MDHIDGDDDTVNYSQISPGGERKSSFNSKTVPDIHLPGDRLSGFDIVRLFLVPLLYVLVAVAAVVVVVYSVLALAESVNMPARSVIYRSNDVYDPIGIVIVPDFAQYLGCQFRYYDDLAPIPPPHYKPHPPFQPCYHENVTFVSLMLNISIKAMVFRGPTHVAYKESLSINYTINTTFRDYSAIEYWLIDDWNKFNKSSLKDKSDLLAATEQENAIHMFPSGMRTWIKMNKIVNRDPSINGVIFQVEPNFAKYTPPKGEEDPSIDHLQVLFEWASPVYEIYDVISTGNTYWSSFGSLCGILLALWKVIELSKALFRKLKRERKRIKDRMHKIQQEKSKIAEEYVKSGHIPSLPSGAKFNLKKQHTRKKKQVE